MRYIIRLNNNTTKSQSDEKNRFSGVQIHRESTYTGLTFFGVKYSEFKMILGKKNSGGKTFRSQTVQGVKIFRKFFYIPKSSGGKKFPGVKNFGNHQYFHGVKMFRLLRLSEGQNFERVSYFKGSKFTWGFRGSLEKVPPYGRHFSSSCGGLHW